jgi:hypothetical protein
MDAAKEELSGRPALHCLEDTNLRGRVNYEASIGNITYTVSPMRSQTFSVHYLSLPGYFVTNPVTDLAPESK